MTSEAVLDLENQLRRAVAEGRHEEIDRLARTYCDSALAFIATLEPGDSRIHRTGSQVKEVLSWANLVLLTARSSIAAPLSSLPLVSRYLQTPQTPPRTRIKA